jgi:hypothetical protein
MGYSNGKQLNKSSKHSNSPVPDTQHHIQVSIQREICGDVQAGERNHPGPVMKIDPDPYILDKI